MVWFLIKLLNSVTLKSPSFYDSSIKGAKACSVVNFMHAAQDLLIIKTSRKTMIFSSMHENYFATIKYATVIQRLKDSNFFKNACLDSSWIFFLTTIVLISQGYCEISICTSWLIIYCSWYPSNYPWENVKGHFLHEFSVYFTFFILLCKMTFKTSRILLI